MSLLLSYAVTTILDKAPLAVPDNINQSCSMDFMHDALTIEIGSSLPAQRAIRSLNQLIEYRGKPDQVRYDNNSEYISNALKD